jgi:hypothetical protein
MAADYINVVSSRSTIPDARALIAALRAQIDSTVGGVFENGSIRLKKDSAWTAQQITTAQSVVDSAPSLTPQRDAQNAIDSWPIELKALALTLLDQINVLRTRAGLVSITPVQALQAIRDKAGTL